MENKVYPRRSEKMLRIQGAQAKGSSKDRDAKWVNRGIISASECFSCTNKVDYRVRDGLFTILCRDPCNYKSLKGEKRPSLDNLENTE